MSWIVTGLGFSCLSFILLLTGMTTDFWSGNSMYHAGLWRNCSEDKCVDIVGIGYINATRGLLIFSALLLLLGMILSGLSFMKIPKVRIMACLASGILHTLADIFLFIGMPLYDYNTHDAVYKNHFKYQWSYNLCWAATVLAFISGLGEACEK